MKTKKLKIVQNTMDRENAFNVSTDSLFKVEETREKDNANKLVSSARDIINLLEVVLVVTLALIL